MAHGRSCLGAESSRDFRLMMLYSDFIRLLWLLTWMFCISITENKAAADSLPARVEYDNGPTPHHICHFLSFIKSFSHVIPYIFWSKPQNYTILCGRVPEPILFPEPTFVMPDMYDSIISLRKKLRQVLRWSTRRCDRLRFWSRVIFRNGDVLYTNSNRNPLASCHWQLLRHTPFLRICFRGKRAAELPHVLERLHFRGASPVFGLRRISCLEAGMVINPTRN